MMNGVPKIETVKPAAALPGGEVAITGSGFGSRNHTRAQVQFGTSEATVMLASENRLIACVPEGASGGVVRVKMGTIESSPFPISLGTQIADNLHPVGNPAVDSSGNIYVTFSGQRGQKVPVSLYKVTSNSVVKPYITDLMNPTGLAIDRDGYLFVSCRHEGTIHRVSPDGRSMQWIEGMGVATGLAFDRAGNLYVRRSQRNDFQDRARTRDFRLRHAGTFARRISSGVQPVRRSVRHRPDDFELRARLPHHAGRRSQHVLPRIGSPARSGVRSRAGNLYVAASFSGRRGIVRLTPDARPEIVLAGSNIVGLALLPTHRAFITTHNALFALDWDVEGLAMTA